MMSGSLLCLFLQLFLCFLQLLYPSLFLPSCSFSCSFSRSVFHCLSLCLSLRLCFFFLVSAEREPDTRKKREEGADADPQELTILLGSRSKNHNFLPRGKTRRRMCAQKDTCSFPDKNIKMSKRRTRKLVGNEWITVVDTASSPSSSSSSSTSASH